jgi:DNA-binding NarL/FixJ family response regulator
VPGQTNASVLSSPEAIDAERRPIRLVIADDHRLVRVSLAFLLQSDPAIEVVGEAENGREAIAKTVALEPDIVLMDLSMPEMDGIEATRQILALRPKQRVLVLTSYSNRERVLEALQAGAKGYLLKDEEPEGLLRGIHAAARGESPLHPRVATVLLENLTVRESEVDVLTEREREVLALVAQGLPNKTIAARLDITTGTVKAHLGRIYQSIGVVDRTQAALWAHRHGVS